MLSFLRTLLGRFRQPGQLASSEDVTGVFLELFRGHGLPCTMKNGWITAESGCLTARAWVATMFTNPTFLSIQLNLEVVTDHGERILESCGGFGKSRSQAIGDALDNFCNGSFHPIYSALTGQPCAHCEVEHWQIDGRSRWVFLGPMVIRGYLPPDEPSARTWFSVMEQHIKASSLVGGLHWIRLYHMEAPTAETVSEVLLDNEMSPVLQADLASCPWPVTDRFYSVRVFLMVTDATESSTV